MKAVSFLLPLVAVATSAVAAEHPASLAGVYDGGQMEIAAGLELTKDGKFRYVLSYGALDEFAAGTWNAAGNSVTLNVLQFESNYPDGDGKFGASILTFEDGVLILPRHDRVLRFRKRGK